MCNCFRSSCCNDNRFDRCVNNAVRAAEAAACRATREARRAQENACRANESAERAACEARVAQEAACRAQNCRNIFGDSCSRCGCNNRCDNDFRSASDCDCNESISFRDFNRMFCC